MLTEAINDSNLFIPNWPEEVDEVAFGCFLPPALHYESAVIEVVQAERLRFPDISSVTVQPVWEAVTLFGGGSSPTRRQGQLFRRVLVAHVSKFSKPTECQSLPIAGERFLWYIREVCSAIEDRGGTTCGRPVD